MRITEIKLSGFKSFVDPTTLELPGNLTGVVGPNGCGKSNIIDAMLWVLGENSAKHLRGDSMADVIFNGSNTRKPVGQASVELLFDNSDATISGQFAGYNEISIKRQVGRDGVSSYYLNGTHCRRRDIIHLFLGTGVGSRSYSVIEQGMISRVIEAKPDELRAFLEEAAGISKYKERRRETENRIRATNENIARLNDIRAELEKQLNHLQRQAKSAEKYQRLKQEERLTQAQLNTLRWRSLNASYESQHQQAEQLANTVEATLSALRAVEAEITHLREAYTDASEIFNKKQSAFYAAGSDLERAEQEIRFTKERRAAAERELAQTRHSRQEVEHHIADDNAQLDVLARQLQQLQPQLTEKNTAEARCSEHVVHAELAMQQWQNDWEIFSQQLADATQQNTVEQLRAEHLRDSLQQAERRIQTLTAERVTLSSAQLAQDISALTANVSNLHSAHDGIQSRQQSVQEQIRQLREALQNQNLQLDQLRQQRHRLAGKLASAEALQQSAMGMDRQGVVEWLRAQNLLAQPRLAASLKVESGWERALETVLPLPLEALCVQDFTALLSALPQLQAGRLAALNRTAPSVTAVARLNLPLLADKVQSDMPLTALLRGVYAAESLAQARTHTASLQADESIVTRDGIWLGRHWLVANRDEQQGAVLVRAQVIQQLQQEIAQLESALLAQQQQVNELQAQLEIAEQSDNTWRQQVDSSHQSLVALRSELAAKQARAEQQQMRLAQIADELTALEDQLAQDREQLQQAVHKGESSRMTAHELSTQRDARLQAREQLRAALQQSREQQLLEREAVQAIQNEYQRVTSQQTAIGQTMQRNEKVIAGLMTRCRELTDALAGAAEPLRQLETERNQRLQARQTAEQDLQQARVRVQEQEHLQRQQDEKRMGIEQTWSAQREDLQQLRVELSGLGVRVEHLREQVQAADFNIDALCAELPAAAADAAWEEKLVELNRKISRLGPINLAAIEEFSTHEERKTYLDRQLADLTEALNTLQAAMHKIDRETRTRFKETFDKVNNGFQTLFPTLFGGGHAYLELDGEDLLETGVTVMARPPGKRNSTIHLLSGGEKALTAVAFVFAIFDLNPAPFCLLDEVDAPLDDVNVVRLCDMLCEKSQNIQFMIITHNKITMEIAQQLIGVTMQEAGVSRLVSVNMDEAVKLAAA